MNYQNYFLYDTTGAQPPLQIYPKGTFKESQIPSRSEGVTLGGKFHTYLPGNNGFEWTIPLDFVSSANRAQINGWWAAQTELMLMVNLTSSNPSTVGSPAPMSCIVRIANLVEPLGQNPEPLRDQFYGGLTLRQSRAGGKANKLGFILDDPVLGKLDQSYNALI